MPSHARSFGFAIVSFALLLVVSPAMAGVPSPPNCSVDPVLVGDSNGMQIGAGFRVTVRDIVGNPVAGSSVTLGFFGTTRPYTVQVAPAAVTCPFIVKSTDAAGHVVFQARFGGFANAPAINVQADGINLKVVPARSTDLDANGATDAFDFVHFRNNFLNSPAAPETDYNQDGVTDPFDFNIFRSVFLNDIPGTLCP